MTALKKRIAAMEKIADASGTITRPRQRLARRKRMTSTPLSDKGKSLKNDLLTPTANSLSRVSAKNWIEIISLNDFR